MLHCRHTLVVLGFWWCWGNRAAVSTGACSAGGAAGAGDTSGADGGADGTGSAGCAGSVDGAGSAGSAGDVGGTCGSSGVGSGSYRLHSNVITRSESFTSDENTTISLYLL